MELKYYSLEKLKKEILEIIGRYLDLKLYKIFFFGSRVTRGTNERADIDIGIEGLNPIDNSILFKIKDEVDDLPILYKIDIVDFRNAADNFRNVALQKIEVIQ